tara:strand:+ start:403 stop:708 length:306 start_codon:yes stop_codon:yes gene_type:complete
VVQGQLVHGVLKALWDLKVVKEIRVQKGIRAALVLRVGEGQQVLKVLKVILVLLVLMVLMELEGQQAQQELVGQVEVVAVVTTKSFSILLVLTQNLPQLCV